MAKASENVFPKVQFSEETAPATPSTGQAVVYVKADGKLYLKDDAGTETDLTASGGGGGEGDWVRSTLGYPITPGANDTLWAGSDYSTDFTQVTVTGTQTVTERNGLLSVKFSGQTQEDWNAALKAHTFTVGDAWAVPMRLFNLVIASGAGIQAVGICFTDGTTSASNVVVGTHITSLNSPGGLLVGYHGTLTAGGTAPWVADAGMAGPAANPWVFARLTYTASNSFTLEFSPDGISWTAFGEAAISKTMTPTHVGVCWQESGERTEAVGTFGPLVKVA